MKTPFTLLLLFNLSICFSQVDPIRTWDYSHADSIALNFPGEKYKSHEKLAIALTENLSTEQDKFRVIFRWITDNIEYRIGRYGTDPDRVLKYKKGVCEGYAHLLKGMCDAIGVESEVVSGYSKTRAKRDINKSLKHTNHAWNVVKLNNQWYLIDVTWASGKIEVKKRKYFKQFDEVYFLADPDFFMLKHYPKERQWLLSDTPIKKKNF